MKREFDIFQCERLQQLWPLMLRKDSNRKLSIKMLSSKLNYASDRSLGMVIKGQRTPSQDMIDRISRYLKLNELEHLYLINLVKKQKLANQNRPTTDVDQTLEKIKPSSAEYIQLSQSDLAVMTNWYYFPLLEVVDYLAEDASLENICTGFEGDVDPKDIKSALKTFEKLGMLHQNKNGIYLRPNRKFLTTTFDVPSSAIQQTHKNILCRAEQALEQQSILDREFISKTVTIDKANLSVIKNTLRQIMESAHKNIKETEDPTDVYQLNLQFYRQARLRD